MKKAFILICIFQLFSLIGSAQGIAKADSVITVIQSGHMIGGIDISADQKYALTSNEKTIALWDIEKRRIIRLVNHPNRQAWFHPLKPFWMMVSHYDNDFLNGNESFYTYDIFTGKRVGG